MNNIHTDRALIIDFAQCRSQPPCFNNISSDNSDALGIKSATAELIMRMLGEAGILIPNRLSKTPDQALHSRPFKHAARLVVA